MHETVAVFGILKFPAESVSEILPHLQKLVRTTCENDGCIAYDVAEDISQPGLFRFSELWPNRQSLEQHLRAPHIGPWRAVARKCGLAERKFTAYDIGGSWEV